VRLAIALAAFAIAAPAAAQTVYRCKDEGGKITYQETPCTGRSAGKRVDLGPTAERLDELDARRSLERDYYRGSELSGRFAGDAREREMLRREREMREREEMARRAREEALKVSPEDLPWNTPWGFPGRPGQALPKSKSKPVPAN
jgi:Domain of unknown function (DUF4124)